MTWNYRVIRKRVEYGEVKRRDGTVMCPAGYEVHDEIAEVFYDENGKAIGWGRACPGSILQEDDAKTVDGLRIVLERMLTALDKPILAEDLTEWVDEASDAKETVGGG